MEKFKNLNLPENHYLKIAENSNSSYFHEFLSSMENLRKKLSEQNFKMFWNEKLQLNKVKFDEKSFIQAACEVAVSNYFRNKENFKVEVKVNPANKKDVDCQFSSNKFIYNIEIKCATFDAKEKVEKADSFKYQTLGRLENKDDLIAIISKAIDDGLRNQGKPLKVHEELKNMDNNLKDFLESAHEKFNPLCDENEVNILLIGCNHPADMQSWVGYLTRDGGHFTREPYSDPKKFNNIDIVVLTNLYFKHKDFHTKKIRSSWSLDETLNLSIVNPNRVKDKKDGILNFSNEFKNYNFEISEFKVSGFAPDSVKEAFRIPNFVIDYLEKNNGIYLFELPIT